MKAFRVLYQDEFLLAIEKPAGFHSHPPEDPTLRISPAWNAQQILEKQVGEKVFPMHRLDRATSGILLFAKESAIRANIQKQFQNHTVKKSYAAVARGHIHSCTIDTPLKRENGTMAAAITHVTALGYFQLAIPGPHGNREFTFLEVEPLTGRFHQIRRHLAQLGFPLVGDTRHGDKKMNRAFAELTGLNRLFLACMKMEIRHPTTGKPLPISTRWHRDWHKLFDCVGLCPRI